MKLFWFLCVSYLATQQIEDDDEAQLLKKNILSLWQTEGLQATLNKVNNIFKNLLERERKQIIQ